MQNIAIFDLDKTLISVDCSDEWITYLCKKNFIKNSKKTMEVKSFYETLYNKGEIRMEDFCHFILQSIISVSIKDLYSILEQFNQFIINNFVYKEALDTVKLHLNSGNEILLISASLNELIEPIGKYFGFKKENIIGIQSIKKNGILTGNVNKPFSFGKGKIFHYKKWLKQQALHFKESFFYSDSIHDTPLLKYVDHAICINPDRKLQVLAKKNHWTLKSWSL